MSLAGPLFSGSTAPTFESNWPEAAVKFGAPTMALSVAYDWPVVGMEPFMPIRIPLIARLDGAAFGSRLMKVGLLNR